MQNLQWNLGSLPHSSLWCRRRLSIHLYPLPHSPHIKRCSCAGVVCPRFKTLGLGASRSAVFSSNPLSSSMSAPAETRKDFVIWRNQWRLISIWLYEYRSLSLIVIVCWLLIVSSWPSIIAIARIVIYTSLSSLQKLIVYSCPRVWLLMFQLQSDRQPLGGF